jgi:hypothetical protein
MIPGIDLIIRKMFVDNILELLIVVPNRFAIDLAPILDPEATVWALTVASDVDLGVLG